MARIVSIHSFRGGTGKSNTTANLAALLAAQGLRVGVVDSDIQSPGIHILFGLKGHEIAYALNDYLWDRCEIQEAAVDVTPQLGAPVSGAVFLIPSSIKSGEIARVLREGCDPQLLTAGFRKLIRALKLDMLVIDTHPGLNEETLLSIAISNDFVLILRPDEQDYEGSGVTVEIANALNVPRLLMVVNKAPAAYQPDEIKARVAETFGCEVAAVIPHSDELMLLASRGIFALRHPDHPVSALYRQIADRLLS
jgi:MinD-like ATPase involved in chromosome partitioning or flagellar assembly